MLLPFAVVLLGSIALIAAGALAVRYLLLRRDLDRYSDALRRDPKMEAAYHLPELEPLTHAVRAMTAARDAQVAQSDRERDRLAAILEQLTDGVLITDSGGVVRWSNPAAKRFFGVSDPVGRTAAEVLRSHQLIEAWRRGHQTGRLQSESVEIPGRGQYLHLIVIPDRFQEGSLLLVQDLTRVRRLETIRRDFISNLSHELRTPLASLKALTETLQNGALSDAEAGPRFLDRIVTEVDALTQMVQELLDLSRIESGQVQLQLSRVPPRGLLETAAARMQVQADRAGLRLRIECPEDLPEIPVDAARLEQVLVNLIHNAIKFTQPGGEVVISAQLLDGRDPAMPGGARAGLVRISVRDTGAGIPSDDLPRIFERFYQVDKSRSGGGTGLGLSIARHIVEAHGGTISVKSDEGRGSTFFLDMPVPPAAAAAA